MKWIEEEETPFLDEIDSGKNYWTAQIGATILASNSTQREQQSQFLDNARWLEGLKLTETRQTLRGPGGTRLPVKGMFHATLKYRQSKITEPVYVLHN